MAGVCLQPMARKSGNQRAAARKLQSARTGAGGIDEEVACLMQDLQTALAAKAASATAFKKCLLYPFGMQDEPRDRFTITPVAEESRAADTSDTSQEISAKIGNSEGGGCASMTTKQLVQLQYVRAARRASRNLWRQSKPVSSPASLLSALSIDVPPSQSSLAACSASSNAAAILCSNGCQSTKPIAEQSPEDGAITAGLKPSAVGPPPGLGHEVCAETRDQVVYINVPSKSGGHLSGTVAYVGLKSSNMAKPSRMDDKLHGQEMYVDVPCVKAKHPRVAQGLRKSSRVAYLDLAVGPLPGASGAARRPHEARFTLQNFKQCEMALKTLRSEFNELSAFANQVDSTLSSGKPRMPITAGSSAKVTMQSAQSSA